MKTMARTITQKELDLLNAMRALWADHANWNRAVTVSAAAGLPDLDIAVNRLMKNQEDIGNAIEPFYGNPAGTKLTELLKQPISQAYDIVVAAKTGDKAKLDSSNKAWYENANMIAEFLTGANAQNWPANMTKKHMKDHLDLTDHEAVVRLQGKWEEDVKAWDAVHSQIMMMSDMLSEGLVKQSPDKFM